MKLSVLVVEDDRAILSVLCEMLEAVAGMENIELQISKARNNEEYQQSLAAKPVLIFQDIECPAEAGGVFDYEVIGFYYMISQQIVIMLITSSNGRKAQKAIETAEAYGLKDRVKRCVKPITMAQLRAALVEANQKVAAEK